MPADLEADIWYSYCFVCGTGRSDRTTFAEHYAEFHKETK